MNDPVFLERRQRNRPEKIIHHIETPKSGGYFVYHISFDYPKKGFVNEYVIQACNFTKRLTITWIRMMGSKDFIPFYFLFVLLPWKIKVIERILKEYCSAASFFLQTYQHKHYLDIQYYTELTRELKKLISIFLQELGIKKEISEEFAFIFATLIEYDTAYRYRLEDLFSESSQEKMLNPRQEINKLIEIYLQREKKRDLPEKFRSFGRISKILLIPRIKKAFIKAIKQIEFSKLQLDEIDHYQIRNSLNYDFFGMTKEERDAKWPLEDHTVLFPEYEALSDQDLNKMFIENIANISP